MQITGAIFDLDGTLLDSMSMWHREIETLFQNLDLTDEEFYRLEPLTLNKTTEALHDEYGLGDSAAGLYREICAYIRHAYATEVKVFPGVRDFLEELSRAKIPLAVASSTPTEEIRQALMSHGLLGYFKDIVSTEDVGERDKIFADVYLEALRRLGSGTPGTTWVFEDAPFAARTAFEAGFCVAGLVREADGRSVQDLTPFCHLVAHGFQEFSLERLEDFEAGELPKATAAPGEALQVLMVSGSPQTSSDTLLRALAEHSDYLVAADRGVDACRSAGIVPDICCGDFDSISREARGWLLEKGIRHIDLPKEKYDTDLSFALDAAYHEALRRDLCCDLTLTCASGGRPDHYLAALGLCVRMAERNGCRVRIVEDAYELRILSGEGAREAECSWSFSDTACSAHRTVSVIPLSSRCRVRERGMVWSAEDLQLEIFSDRGVSNRLEERGAEIRCLEGTLAVFLMGTPLQ